MAATQSTRPVNLKLSAFRFPISAISSILHRISGIALFFGIGYLTYLLGLSLQSPESFAWVRDAVRGGVHGAAVWLIVSAVIYHFIAGVRHLLLDFHVGDSVVAGRRSAWTAIGLSALGSLAFGAWIFI